MVACATGRVKLQVTAVYGSDVLRRLWCLGGYGAEGIDEVGEGCGLDSSATNCCRGREAC